MTAKSPLRPRTFFGCKSSANSPALAMKRVMPAIVCSPGLSCELTSTLKG
jgi:hypothetical protein